MDREKGEEDVYGGFWHSHYMHNRDMMVSNLMKLNTHQMNMGQGHPSCVRFNHRDEPTMMTYIFKYPSETNDQFEFYGAFPREYDSFFEKYDIQDPKLDWKEIQENYVQFPRFRQYIREYPCLRGIRIYPKRDFCEKRRDKKANFGVCTIYNMHCACMRYCLIVVLMIYSLLNCKWNGIN